VTQFSTCPEVAQLFRVSVYTIRRWAHDPDHPLKPVQIGKRFLFPRDEVERIIADQRRTEA
jgi:excisionase family DNA binding protein